MTCYSAIWWWFVWSASCVLIVSCGLVYMQFRLTIWFGGGWVPTPVALRFGWLCGLVIANLLRIASCWLLACALKMFVGVLLI